MNTPLITLRSSCDKIDLTDEIFRLCFSMSEVFIVSIFSVKIKVIIFVQPQLDNSILAVKKPFSSEVTYLNSINQLVKQRFRLQQPVISYYSFPIFHSS